MKKMRIGFDFFMDETPLFLQVARVLERKYGLEIAGVSLGRRWKKLLRRAGYPVLNLGEYLSEHWDEFDTSESGLGRLEQEYGTPHLSRIIYADKYFVRSVHPRRYTHEYVMKMLVGHFRFWESFLNESRIDAFVGPGVQAMFDLTRLRVMDKRQRPNLGLYSTRLPTGRFVVCRSDADHWEKVVARYKWLLSHDVPDIGLRQAREFLEAFRRTSERPAYMKVPWKKLGPRALFLEEFARRIRRHYFEGWGRGTDYVTPHPLWSMYDRGLRPMFLSCWHRILNVFEIPQKHERFVFFPLHFQPEATTLLWGAYFADQLAVIENVAKSIPVSCRLYVKEHSSSIGRRPGGYYKRIKELPNVRLITPAADSHALIRRAALNIVITSTVGWEALLYERPVVVLGNVFYNDSGLTYRVTDMTSLSDVVQQAMGNEVFDREKLLKFIAAIYWGSYPGVFDVPHQNPSVMQPDNVERLAEGMYLDLENRHD